MKLFARACLAASLALVPLACGDDEEKGSPTPDEDSGGGPECGNGTVEEGEDCETGDTESCDTVTMGTSPEGDATCSTSCEWVTSACSSGSTARPRDQQPR
jgi:hypothetical protein